MFVHIVESKGQFHITLWVPEGTRNQEISFDSILGVVQGEWETPFTLWRDA